MPITDTELKLMAAAAIIGDSNSPMKGYPSPFAIRLTGWVIGTIPVPLLRKDQAMNDLSPSERELVALGAAMGSNCVPCIEYHIPEARKTGLTDAQIQDAIRLADRVRQVPARKVLDAALRMLPEKSAGAQAEHDAPGCAQGAPAATTDAPCCS